MPHAITMAIIRAERGRRIPSHIYAFACVLKLYGALTFVLQFDQAFVKSMRVRSGAAKPAMKKLI